MLSKKTLDFLKEEETNGGFGIYRKFQHHCGHSGNSFERIEKVWRLRTHCPKCKEVLIIRNNHIEFSGSK